ncbi:hypothetical protein CXF43_08495 [Corynebacterium bovis]|nr:hypothetical protein CXF32_00110 [Corynebacterium bovis]RRQ00680.1 hypothetical protein CXF31_00125 [Corynebacterium bovis]RRQ06457.1 hypothetical protein CXF43_08495 [Corynebacterium bovis]RRQ09554.1 hypothetical protein CXF44_07945 [Corynebacterium bovis]
MMMAKSNTVATSAERFSPEWYTVRRLGEQFELVLRIADRIADGATAPAIDDFDAVKVVLKASLSGAAWEQAKARSKTILSEWTADQAATQAKQVQAEWLKNLSEIADGVRAGDTTTGGGLAGLFGTGGGQDAGAESARKVLEADRLRKTALLVAVGPQVVPGYAWEKVLAFAGVDDAPGAAGAGGDDDEKDAA